MMVQEGISCEECESAESTVRCVNCVISYCQQCFDAIHSHRVFKSHEFQVLHKPQDHCEICVHRKLCSVSFTPDRIDMSGIKISSVITQPEQIHERSRTEDLNEIEEFFKQICDIIQCTRSLALASVARKWEERKALLKGLKQKAGLLSAHSNERICRCKEVMLALKNAEEAVNAQSDVSDLVVRITVPSTSQVTAWLTQYIQNIQMDPALPASDLLNNHRDAVDMGKDSLIPDVDLSCIKASSVEYLESSLSTLSTGILTVPNGSVGPGYDTDARVCQYCEEIASSHVLERIMQSDDPQAILIHKLARYAGLGKGSEVKLIDCISPSAILLGVVSRNGCKHDGKLPLKYYSCGTVNSVMLEVMNMCIHDNVEVLLLLNVANGKFYKSSQSHLRSDVPCGHEVHINVAIACMFEPLLETDVSKIGVDTGEGFREMLDSYCGSKSSNKDPIRLDDVQWSPMGRFVVDFRFTSSKGKSVNLKTVLAEVGYGKSGKRIKCLSLIKDRPVPLPPAELIARGRSNLALVTVAHSYNRIFMRRDEGYNMGFANNMEAILTNLDRTRMTDVDVATVDDSDVMYLSEYDDVLCRTVIVGSICTRSVTHSEHFYLVYYPDYGNLHLIDTKHVLLFVCPRDIAGVPLALECFRVNESHSRQKVLWNELQSYENRVIDLETMQIRNWPSSFDEVSTVEVTIGYVDSQRSSVYLSAPDNKTFLNQVNATYTGNALQLPLVDQIDCEDLVVVYDSNDSFYYRGMVKPPSNMNRPDEMAVFLVDVGLVRLYHVDDAYYCLEDLKSVDYQAENCIVIDRCSGKVEDSVRMMAYLRVAGANVTCEVVSIAQDGKGWLSSKFNKEYKKMKTRNKCHVKLFLK